MLENTMKKIALLCCLLACLYGGKNEASTIFVT